MKNLFALIFILLTTFCTTNAQISLAEKTFNHAYQTECVDFERYDENHWLIGNTAYQLDFIYYRSGRFYPEIMMVDNQGEIVWKTSFTQGVVDLADIHLLNDSTILALERYYGSYDIFYDDYILHVLNAQGEILKTISFYDFFSDLEYLSGEAENPFLKILPLSDNKIGIVYSDGRQSNWSNKVNGIFQVDLETEEISILKEWNIQTLSIYDAFLQNNGKIVLATNEGIWKLDETGEIELQYDSETSILKVTANNAISKTHFLQFDAELNILQNIDFSNRFDYLVNFDIADEHLWLIGKNKSSDVFQFEKIPLTDLNASPTFTSIIAGNKTIPTGLQAFDDKILVMGNEQTLLTPRAFFKTYEAETGETQIFDTDIGIEEVSFVNFQEGGIFFGYNFETYISLKNYGTDTIHQFCINYQDFRGYSGQKHWIYPHPSSADVINLAPNETMKIGPLGGFTVSGKLGDEKEICVWTTGPNNHIDRNSDNNSICQTVVLADIAASIAPSKDISVFPNPFHQNLSLQTQTKLFQDAQISLFNIQGKIVYKGQITENQTILELTTLKQGVYLLEVQKDGKRWTERVVKY